MEDRVCAGYGVEEGGGVGALGVEGWGGGGEGPVLCLGEDEVLGYGKDQQHERRKDRLNAVKRVSAYLVGCLLRPSLSKRPSS